MRPICARGNRGSFEKTGGTQIGGQYIEVYLALHKSLGCY
ncbi:hypothetical protein CLV24_1242 [Pontibacter ummariensis]|nr:hypothetical protein CLV24_1242 [Pontibacter ummariensis]